MKIKRFLPYIPTVILGFVTTPILAALETLLVFSRIMDNINNSYLVEGIVGTAVVLVIPIIGLIVLAIAVYKRHKHWIVYATAYLLSIVIYYFVMGRPTWGP